MIANAATFGRQASHYAAARPAYPDALFDWIAAEAPGRGAVWDVGTGSGQAARSLAARFERVHATDADGAQVAAAAPHPRIRYEVRPAETSGLPDADVHAVTVATALHWFDLGRFWPEVRRVAAPGALFAAWTYTHVEADPEIERRLLAPVLSMIEPYWSEGNRLSWRGYPPEEIGFPFTPVPHPDFACALDWRPTQLAGFLRSWSAHLKARQDGLTARLAEIERAALASLGDAPRRVTLPLTLRAGRIGKP